MRSFGGVIYWCIAIFIVFCGVHLFRDHQFDAMSFGASLAAMFGAKKSFEDNGHIARYINMKYTPNNEISDQP